MWFKHCFQDKNYTTHKASVPKSKFQAPLRRMPFQIYYTVNTKVTTWDNSEIFENVSDLIYDFKWSQTSDPILLLEFELR